MTALRSVRFITIPYLSVGPRSVTVILFEKREQGFINPESVDEKFRFIIIGKLTKMPQALPVWAFTYVFCHSIS